MLLVGTEDHLEDLDRQFSVAEYVSVTGIAPASGRSTPFRSAGADVHVLLDGGRIARVGEFDISPVASLPDRTGQSIADATGTTGNATVLVGSSGAHLAVVDVTSGVVDPVTAFDAVAGRDEWENPAGPSPDLRSIAVTQSGAWLVNVHVGGVWRSDDLGSSWTNVIEPETDVHEVVAGDDGRVVVAAAVGFGWSADDGLTWTWTTEGLHASYCRAVAIDGDVAFVTASTGPRTQDGRLYRGTLGGGLVQCTAGLPPSFPFNLDTGSVASRAGQVAVGARDGRVWRSSDGGDSFERVTERVGHVRVLRFA